MQAFEKLVLERYGLRVRSVKWENGAMRQGWLWISCDFPESLAALRDAVIQNTAGQPLNTPECYDAEYVRLAQRIIDDYTDCTCIDRTCYSDIFLNLQDNKTNNLRYAYGHGIHQIRKDILRCFPLDPRQVLVFYDTTVTIRACNKLEYALLRMAEKSLRRCIYRGIKAFDKENLFTEADAVLQILHKGMVSPEQWHNMTIESALMQI